ncbi:hypothetical protein V6N12_059232 [Hibiscus sabdariffa]|uniref:Peptidase M28 domain-containing protein n=1 Tax=Hibiscus sabdariffa TaxID=183260 RepID=A0ABR2EUG4_9ROSI
MSLNLTKPNISFTLCTFLFLVILVVIDLYTVNHPPRNPKNTLFFRQLFLSSTTNYTVSSYLCSLTSHPHLVGTKPSLETIHYVKAHFQNLGLETHTMPFRTLLSYPLHASVSMHFSNGTVFNLPLNKMNISNYNVSSGLIQPYHAFYPSRTVQGKVVFANHRTEDDYGVPGRMGVKVSGCIVMVKKGGSLGRGAVVEMPEKMGALGVLLYAEGDVLRGSFGFGVERGTIMKGAGDPLTPVWAGVEDGERLELDDNKVAERGPLAPQGWRDSGRSNLSRVGPGLVMVNFTYEGEKTLAIIYNVFDVIRGLEEPNCYVLMGNYRDEWTYGVVDPNSGTATLLDIAQRYALLMRKGWKPRRTIIICSCDAEEFGMIGSTEWVEQNLVNLGAKTIAYLNVDCAVQGPGFFAGATPQLDNLIFEVTKKVKDPDSVVATIYDKWKIMNGESNLERLTGLDSNFAPFLQHVGVPSVDIYYVRDFPVCHIVFDSFN